MKTYWVLQYCSKVSYQSVSSCSRLQGFIINFLKNIFTSVLAPQIAIASLGGSGMVRKENNYSKIKVKKKEKAREIYQFSNIERFSLDCRKTKTKVNALANKRA